MADRTTVYMALTELRGRGDPRNPRRHDLPSLKDAMRRVGFTEPVVLDERTGYLVAGHGRIAALAALKAAAADLPDGIGLSSDASGLAEWMVPVTRGWTSKDDDAALVALLGSNRLAEHGSYDTADLLEHLAALGRTPAGLDGTGYRPGDVTDLERALAKLDDPKPAKVGGTWDSDADAPADTQPGDLWLLGDHRILCGDSTVGDTWDRLLAGDTADAIWTDPPYGVNYAGGLNEVRRRQIRNDNLKREALAGLLAGAFGQADSRLTRGGPVYVCAPPGPAFGIFLDAVAAHWPVRQVLAWVKHRITPGGGDYQGQWEPVIYARKPGRAAGRGKGFGWYADNTASNVLHVSRPMVADAHPTMKPVDLIVPMLTATTRAGDLVVDCFAGSGTTLAACEQTHRRAALIDDDPHTVDQVVARWARLTSGKPERRPA